ncbi:putative cuticle protein [Operophtera brumata]|uniref:Putative cuticle protein n=1 Tax=Operophtera brumata TaxID=104452 RepID=A0A0L7K433_OPEBR|nr:putative cuticle protein [Operophtera brumata]
MSLRDWKRLPATFCVIVRDPPHSATDYKYSYDIDDPTTGDSKSQHEVRQGDIVSGAYSFVGPDGTRRIVEYTADSKHGFQASIREEQVEETSPQPLKEKLPYVSKSRFDTMPVYSLEAARLPLQDDADSPGKTQVKCTMDKEATIDDLQILDDCT